MCTNRAYEFHVRIDAAFCYADNNCCRMYAAFYQQYIVLLLTIYLDA